MTEGHPAFVANNGRSASTSTTTPPTRRRPAPRCAALAGGAPWRGAPVPGAPAGPRTSTTSPSSARTCSCDFEQRLRERGLDPADYLYLPVHPWQWTQPARRHLRRPTSRAGRPRPPRRGPPRYRAQQSIRTFFNRRPPGAVLREGGAVDPEHGLHARALAGLHGGHTGDQRLGRRLVAGDDELRRPSASRCCASSPRSARPATSTSRSPCRRPTARCWPRCGARARCRGSRRGRAAGHHGVPAPPGPRRRSAGGRAGPRLRARRRPRGCAAYLDAYLAPARALPARPRPGLHAARREPRPGAARRTCRADGHEGHRRGGRGARRPPAARRGRADPRRRARPTWRPSRSTPTSSTASCATSAGSSPRPACSPARRLLGPGRATACPGHADRPSRAGVRRATYDLLREEFPHSLPQPAPAPQHPPDGRPRRPGRVAHLRRVSCATRRPAGPPVSTPGLPGGAVVAATS